jgi:hypothetical protein
MTTKSVATALLAIALLGSCASIPDQATPDVLPMGLDDPADPEAATVWATQGWRITHVDARRVEWNGRPQPAFAVQVPAGDHEFSFRHETPGIESFYRLRARVEAGRGYRFHGHAVGGSPPVFELSPLEPGKTCTVNYNEYVGERLVFC